MGWVDLAEMRLGWVGVNGMWVGLGLGGLQLHQLGRGFLLMGRQGTGVFDDVISAGSKYAGEWRGGSFGLFVS